MASFIPAAKLEKLAWARNFKTRFPASAASYGLSAEQTAKAIAACDTIIYSIMLAMEAKSFAKRCTLYRDGVFSKESTPRDVPKLTLPAAPPVLMPENPVGYLQKVAQFIKAQSIYTAADGAALGIVVPPSASASALANAKPKGKTKALPNSVVRVDWTKGKAHGVIVQSQRGDETEWTTLDRDMYSPYIDTRPPLAAGKPEERRYRLCYFFNDEPVGDWSLIFTAITLP